MGKKAVKKAAKEEKSVSRVRTFSIPLNHPSGYSLLGRTKVKVPREMEVPIFLIRHELKSRMFFNVLSEVGFTDSYFEAYLDSLILASVRLRDGSDETFKVYTDLMEKWSGDINADEDVIIRRAIKIYNALVKYRIDVFETLYIDSRYYKKYFDDKKEK